MNTTSNLQAPIAAPANRLDGVAALSHLGVIKVEGEDAAKFIHGQLSQDFSLLDMHTARLAAFCSPKGRVLASFIGFKRNAHEILLICSKDVLPATLKRLSMFVMRAKAKLSDASEAYQLFGLAGSATKSIATGDYSRRAKVDFDACTLVELAPADGVARQLWLAPADAPAPEGASLSAAIWLWSEVRSGVATVTAPVSDAFVPQMLNYESIGGVNFKKGCYPGQEVVARSQFRGTLKRRTFVVHGDVAMAAGEEVFGSADESQPVATVVQAAPNPQGGFDALISGQVSAIEQGTLHFGTNTGAVLTHIPLPYPLLDDI